MGEWLACADPKKNCSASGGRAQGNGTPLPACHGPANPEDFTRWWGPESSVARLLGRPVEFQYAWWIFGSWLLCQLSQRTELLPRAFEDEFVLDVHAALLSCAGIVWGEGRP